MDCGVVFETLIVAASSVVAKSFFTRSLETISKQRYMLF